MSHKEPERLSIPIPFCVQTGPWLGHTPQPQRSKQIQDQNNPSRQSEEPNQALSELDTAPTCLSCFLHHTLRDSLIINILGKSTFYCLLLFSVVLIFFNLDFEKNGCTRKKIQNHHSSLGVGINSKYQSQVGSTKSTQGKD